MYSEEGRGTAFKIFLPRQAAGVAVESSSDEVDPQRGMETILLVEDEELLRSVVREAMEEHGYQVLEARTPAEALQLSTEFPGTIDLLVTDMIMPGMDGQELAKRVSAQRPATRIILMSGYTQHSVRNGTTLPGVRYLEKPIPTTLLLQTIRVTLDES
jgi:two-component system, cell cycle sensor histidine kinase and response regulator CckA